MIRSLLILLAAGAMAAADPYEPWSQGRPAEAVPPLIAAARASGRWDAWLDAGLAAAAAGDRGRAVACLAEAHNRAPDEAAPRDALRSLGAALPTTWSERAGPVAIPGRGWTGIAVLAAAGLLLGAGIALRSRRGLLLTAGGLAVVAAAPGVIAPWVDGRTAWTATVRDSEALDSTGAPLRALPAGTLLARAADEPWSGRILVRLGDGALAYVAETDTAP